MIKVVLLRHGETEWNKESRFAGWTDVALNEKGTREAMEAGRALRFLPYCRDVIAPAVRSGSRVIVVAHGNTLGALVMFLNKIPEDKIGELDIPTGIPLVYELSDDLAPIRNYCLRDP